MRLILRMREKGGVNADFTHARSRVSVSRSDSLPGHLTSDRSLVSRQSCTHDALVIPLLCNLPSVRAIPRSLRYLRSPRSLRSLRSPRSFRSLRSPRSLGSLRSLRSLRSHRLRSLRSQYAQPHIAQAQIAQVSQIAQAQAQIAQVSQKAQAQIAQVTGEQLLPSGNVAYQSQSSHACFLASEGLCCH